MTSLAKYLICCSCTKDASPPEQITLILTHLAPCHATVSAIWESRLHSVSSAIEYRIPPPWIEEQRGASRGASPHPARDFLQGTVPLAFQLVQRRLSSFRLIASESLAPAVAAVLSPNTAITNSVLLILAVPTHRIGTVLAAEEFEW